MHTEAVNSAPIVGVAVSCGIALCRNDHNADISLVISCIFVIPLIDCMHASLVSQFNNVPKVTIFSGYLI